MTEHLRRSRVTKAFADAGLAGSFESAEARLDSVEICVVVGSAEARTAAGQAAVLTALATSIKSFGRATLACSDGDVLMIAAQPLGVTLAHAGEQLGARVVQACPSNITHAIHIGASPGQAPWRVFCWWDRWCAGARVAPSAPGDSRVALAGSFAGALAVRQVFAHVRFGKSAPPRDVTLSLWRPELGGDISGDDFALGPENFVVPDAIWFLGLGHLGQAAIWTIGLLPVRGKAIVQDDQFIGEENEPTSLVVCKRDVGVRKTRVAGRWLEAADWSASVIERRHYGDIAVLPHDPPFLLSGLDDLTARRTMAKVGFDYMIDVGVGHGPRDFEGIQIRIVPKGAPMEHLWSDAVPHRNDGLLEGDAYKTLDAKVGACGAYAIAKASVAVPFVGAAASALAFAQMIRLASGEDAVALLQVDLASPEMVIDGGRVAAASTFLGGVHVDLNPVSLTAQPQPPSDGPDSL